MGGDLSQHFSRHEFRCTCGCGADAISSLLVARLQRMRERYQKPIQITSGVRCRAFNELIGGVPDSAHVPADIGRGEGEVGNAADIPCLSSEARFDLLSLAVLFFDRIGVGPDFLHVDVDLRKPQGVIWHYYQSDHVA